MREAGQILLGLFNGRIEGVHQRRLQAVAWAVTGAVAGGRVGLTAIGRACPSGSAKHAIKRSDRLLKNEKLFANHWLFFAAVARSLIGDAPHAAVLVDWTGAGEGRHALVAALVHDGRAIPFAFELHATAAHGAPPVEEAFLERLKTEGLPAGCVPVLVTDAGFRTDWVLAARRLGMDFVTRIPGRTLLLVQGRWQKAGDLATAAGNQPTDVGDVAMTQGRKVIVRVVRNSRYRPSARQKRSRAKHGHRRTRAARRSATTPWVLATSLTAPPDQVVALYAKRMQIEEHFRDNKSHRFGLALRYARHSTLTRYANLTLLACLVAIVLAITGRVAESCQFQRLQQANTIRNRRVLALTNLARTFLRRPSHRHMHIRRLRRELVLLQRALSRAVPE